MVKSFYLLIFIFSICNSETITGICSDPVCDSINWVLIQEKLGKEYVSSEYPFRGQRITATGAICYIDTFPEEIGNLTELTSLNFKGSLQSGTLKHLPTSIGNLTKLQFLDLSNNQLEELPPTIGRLVNLKTLRLERNNLQTLPDSIVRIVNLKRNLDLPGYEFELDWNHICSLPSAVEGWVDTMLGVNVVGRGDWMVGQCNDCPKGQRNCSVSTKKPSYHLPVNFKVGTPSQYFDLRGKKLCLIANGNVRNSLPQGCYIIKYGTATPYFRRYIVP